MKKNSIPIYGLDDYGLTLPTLAALGDRPITLRVMFKHINETRLFSLAPEERKAKIDDWYRKSFAAMKRRWPVKHFKQLGSQERPSGICGRVAAKQVRALRRLPHIAYVWIETIPGLKRKKLPATQRWFAVQARFAIQIEGQTKGRQSYEDRIVIVKATSAKEAQRKLRRNFKDYGRPYLNPEGYMVKWVFESILDIYELMDTTIDPNGTEVFSRFGGRRLKPLSR